MAAVPSQKNLKLTEDNTNYIAPVPGVPTEDNIISMAPVQSQNNNIRKAAVATENNWIPMAPSSTEN